jgi:hypothetical protein
MIDLRLFYCKHWWPPSMPPFAHGEFVYATDGRILIRVPDEDGWPPASGAISESVLAKLLAVPDDAEFVSLARVKFPAAPFRECWACEGRGTEHDCQGCIHKCDDCGGEGVVAVKQSVSIGAALFDVRYIELIASIYGEISPQVAPSPSPFRFDEGLGAVMGLMAPGSSSNEFLYLGDVERFQEPAP